MNIAATVYCLLLFINFSPQKGTADVVNLGGFSSKDACEEEKGRLRSELELICYEEEVNNSGVLKFVPSESRYGTPSPFGN